MKLILSKYIIILTIALCASTILLCSGCLYIPFRDREGVGGILQEDTKKFTVAKTSRSDVLLCIGPPNIRHDNDRLFIYKWHGTYGWIASSGGSPTVQSQEALCLFFNPDNTLESYKYLSKLLLRVEDDDPRCQFFKYLFVCDEKWKLKLIERCIQEEKQENQSMPLTK